MRRDEVTDLERIERAQIDTLISTAKAYPRDIHKARNDAIALATMDEETARECFYSLPRGGKTIEGPSIRCAEIVASCWGNLRSGSRVLTDDGKTVTAQAFCHDLERNVFTVKETKRRITDKNGKTYNEDMIVVTGNATAAVSLRNAVFGVIPQSVVRSVYNEAKKVAVGKAGTIRDRWNKSVTKFAGIPVTEAQLFTMLGRKSVDEITPDDLIKAFGVFTALKEGQATVDEIFPPEVVPEPPKVGDAQKVERPSQPKTEPKKRGRPAKQDAPPPAPEPEPEPMAEEPDRGDAYEPEPEPQAEEEDDAPEGGPFAAKKKSKIFDLGEPE